MDKVSFLVLKTRELSNGIKTGSGLSADLNRKKDPVR